MSTKRVSVEKVALSFTHDPLYHCIAYQRTARHMEMQYDHQVSVCNKASSCYANTFIFTRIIVINGCEGGCVGGNDIV